MFSQAFRVSGFLITVFLMTGGGGVIVLGGLGRDFRAFWVILGYYGLFWVIGVFLADLRMIFAGAPCCLLLLSWSLSSK